MRIKILMEVKAHHQSVILLFFVSVTTELLLSFIYVSRVGLLMLTKLEYKLQFYYCFVDRNVSCNTKLLLNSIQYKYNK